MQILRVRLVYYRPTTASTMDLNVIGLDWRGRGTDVC